MLAFFRRLGFLAAAGAALGITALALIVAAALLGMPSVKSIADYQPPVSSRVYAQDGQLVGVFARENRSFAPIESIPDHVIAAFMAAEDKDFYSHSGVDWSGVVRASISNINNVASGRRLEGASTITQQVAQNVLVQQPENEGSAIGKVVGKVREIALAIRIEGQVSKDRILELYLNQIFLGLRSYGVSAAAQNYFGKSLDEISLAQAAYLGALPKAPNNYHPTRFPERALARRNWVLDRMATNGFITAAQAAASKAEPLNVQTRAAGSWAAADAGEFVEEVRRELIRRFGEDAPYTRGFAIRSSLDLRLQEEARRALRRALEAFDRQQNWRGPLGTIDAGAGWPDRLAAFKLPPMPNRAWTRGVVLADGGRIGIDKGEVISVTGDDVAWAKRSRPLAVGQVIWVGRAEKRTDSGAIEPGAWQIKQEPNVQGGMVAIETHTGRVLAMVGGYSTFSTGFNRATQAYRQPGSSVKPLVYAAALERGFTKDSIFSDAPFTARNNWSPKNSDGRFYGAMPVSRALALSRNTVTVRVAQATGIRNVVDYFRRFGAYDKVEPNLAIALGAADTTVYRLTAAYSVFTNGGRYVAPSLFDRLQDGRGATVWRADDRACPGCANFTKDDFPPLLGPRGTQVMNPANAWTMIEMLEGAVANGTGYQVKALGRTVGGKTGTTNDNKDAWFVGFTPTIVAGVYIGYDQPRSMGRAAVGGLIAAPVFRDFMAAALKGVPDSPFAASPELVGEINRVRQIRAIAAAKMAANRPAENPNAPSSVRTTPAATITFDNGEPVPELRPRSGEEPQKAPEEVGGLY